MDVSSFVIDEKQDSLLEEIFHSVSEPYNFEERGDQLLGEHYNIDYFLYEALEMAIDEPYHDLLYDEDLDMAMLASFDDAPKGNPVSQECIEKLEEVKIEALGLDCVICLDQLVIGTEAKRLPCLHVYHGNCIVKWLRHSNMCPLCRYQMPTAS